MQKEERKTNQKQVLLAFMGSLLLLLLLCFNRLGQLPASKHKNSSMAQSKNKNSMDTTMVSQGHLEVNGISLYYEIHGKGKPLVLLHGGGSTIATSFGRIIPGLAPEHQLICVELQAHGRTGDRQTGLSFTQDADDVAALLKRLGIHKADVLGFSNGGNTALQLAIRHPELCNKVIAASALLKKKGAPDQFWEFMKTGTFEQMPQAYKEAFLEVNPDTAQLMNMYEKCAARMNGFVEFTDEELKAIQVPVLLINGTEDVASSEHMLAMSRLIPDCQLSILPGGHGAYLGEITTLGKGNIDLDVCLGLVSWFLDR